MIMMMLPAGVVLAQQKPVTGYAPVNGLKMYYEVHGSGEPVVLLHGAFMAITDDWRMWIDELAKTRKVIAVEMQGHGRTADIKRDITYDNLGDDVAALLDYLKIERADLVGYSLGADAAMNCAIRHPEKVRKVVSISHQIDEYQLSVQPTVIGNGLQLFKDITDRVDLKPLKTKTFDCGAVTLYYEPTKR